MAAEGGRDTITRRGDTWLFLPRFLHSPTGHSQLMAPRCPQSEGSSGYETAVEVLTTNVGGASHLLASDLWPCNFNKLNLKKGKRSPGSCWIIHSCNRVSRRTPLWRVSNSYSLISPALQDPQVRIQFKSQKREENLTHIFLDLGSWVISEFANRVAIGDSILKNNFEELGIFKFI